MIKKIPSILYFYVHFVCEVLCFYSLANVVGNNYILWIIPLFYDAFAFVPQALVGSLNDRYPKLPIGLLGAIFLLAGTILLPLKIVNIFVAFFLITLGNACIHIDGAETTLKCGEGRIGDAGIFVAGGSFGVVTGKLLGSVSVVPIIILGLSLIPTTILGMVLRNNLELDGAKKMHFNNPKVSPLLIIVLATFVVVVRGYMGYGIPTSWNKTVLQTILLYSSMGIGKMIGGILVDKIGIRKTIYISVLGAIPFLIFGDHLMYISLIGIMLFSMTMSVTLAIIVSVLKDNPGLGFGFTTIGLFLGTLPIFFIKINSLFINIVMIVSLSIICLIILLLISSREKKI